jgi:hypothetical protein
MKDGLYLVDYKDICAGFVIENGKVTRCAPILRRNFEFWKSIAVRHKVKRKRQSLLRDDYKVISADPPWEYNITKVRGAAENHYPTMTI